MCRRTPSALLIAMRHTPGFCLAVGRGLAGDCGSYPKGRHGDVSVRSFSILRSSAVGA
jgi:hypothetical protein